jgi:aminopeptidase N
MIKNLEQYPIVRTETEIGWTPEKLIRFENRIVEHWESGKIRGPIHLSNGNEKELIEIGMKQNVYVRQAIAETMSEIPDEIKSQYETFLDDDSYKTKEIALINLCNSFPNQVSEYLEKLKNLQGNNDKSLRITWLKIALNFNKNTKYKELYFNELLNHTSSNNESSVRQNALEVLLDLYPENEQVIRALFQATTHHKWQFTKFAKEKIRTLLKQSDFRNQVENLVKTADEKTTNLYLKFLKE